jgi:hypothetical protein
MKTKNKTKLKILLLVLILVCCLPLTACYDAVEIDEEVYALVIGVDKGTTNIIRVTVKYETYKEGGEEVPVEKEEDPGKRRAR